MLCQKRACYLTLEDLKDASPEDYIRLFTQYLGLMLGNYVRYVQQGSVDFARDNVLFQTFPLYLSSSDTQALGQALNAALLPYLKNEPSPERQRTIFWLTSLPDVTHAPFSADETTALAKE